MKKKKSIAVAVVLALILLIGGLLAYFTDTDTKTNDFTLGGEVDISLAETGWDALTDSNNNDIPDIAEGIHPGTTVTKDPTVTNETTDTPAYVFVEAVVPCYDSDDDGTVDAPLFILNSSTAGTAATTTPNSGWYLVNTPSVDTTSNTITYVFAYGNSTGMTALGGAGTTATTSTSPFSSVTLEPTLQADQAPAGADAADIVVNAYGIQTDGFTNSTPSQVWTALQNDLP